jgi:hypothetical protein
MIKLDASLDQDLYRLVRLQIAEILFSPDFSLLQRNSKTADQAATVVDKSYRLSRDVSQEF